ncbi:MAG: ABC transporter permease subunit [Sulfolobales archaeon]
MNSIYVRRKSDEPSTVKIIITSLVIFAIIVFLGIFSLMLLSGYELKDFINIFFDYRNLLSPITIRYCILIALLSLAFLINVAGGFINLGGEGLIALSMLAFLIASVYNLGVFTAFVLSILLLIAWASIPYVSKVYLESSDVLISFLQNFIALFIINHIVTHVFRGELARPRSPPIDPSINLHYISQDNILYNYLGRVSIESIIVLLVAVVFLTYLLSRTKIGYSLRLLSYSTKTASISGVNIPRAIFLNLLISAILISFASAELLLGGERKIFYNENAKIGIGSMSFGLGYVSLSIAILSIRKPYISLLYSYILALGYVMVFSSYGFYRLILGVAIVGLSLLSVLLSELLLRYEVRLNWRLKH